MRLLPLFAALLAAPALIAAAPAARMPIASFEQLGKPLPLPYDEAANADAAVAAAKARAVRGHRLLLIDLGGNWCLDCRILAGTMDVPVLKAWLAKRYEIVTVDIGRFDKNLQIPALRHYEAARRRAGVADRRSAPQPAGQRWEGRGTGRCA